MHSHAERGNEGLRGSSCKMLYEKKYDVIIIGGGHAGTEAALASARIGASTLLLTHNIETLGAMSCNPAIGGIGKGHLVKEIDALGGVMAHATDKAGIQFRTLNASKGPAVRATRAQADRILYKAEIWQQLQNQVNLDLFQQAVEDLIVEDNKVIGVKTKMGLDFYCHSVVLTVGTFLGGLIHIGLENYQGGRAGDPPSNGLAQRLRDLPFHVERLKTGTPPRIDKKSIDFSVLEEQAGDTPTPVFSYLGNVNQHPQQVSCHITRTNQQTHDIIRAGLDRSPMYSGIIEGTGPRYCPSIEDKIIRFADRDSHQIFVEPEGLTSHEIYPNGISTSLPFDVQIQFVRSMKGFENARIVRPGYAIEYDYFDPRDLRPTLESKNMPRLYFAGQINGTTGYEEAAAQGLLAGLNAARAALDKEQWTPTRDQAYLGVLVDDLITMGTKEPYRMFTSRAEYRLLLREDNADMRLTEMGRNLGLVNNERWQQFNQKREAIIQEQQRLKDCWIHPKDTDNALMTQILGEPLKREARASDLLLRPEMNYLKLHKFPQLGQPIADPSVAEQVEIQAKYAGYIERQMKEVLRQKNNETLKLSDNLDFKQVKGLSNEVIEKLTRHRPATIGQAGRISGVTPAAISLLLIHIKKSSLV